MRALHRLDREPEVDVIVLTRGGGSIEDLLPFSDERLCRAIAACTTPVVSAVGHERDTPLCDLVADARASTPTAAARLVVPDRDRSSRSSTGSWQGRGVAPSGQSRERGRALAALGARPALRRPEHWVATRREALARARAALDRAPAATLGDRRERVDALAARLRAVAPEATLRRGYALVLDADGAVVTDAGLLHAGQSVALSLARGRARARVEEVEAS